MEQTNLTANCRGQMALRNSIDRHPAGNYLNIHLKASPRAVYNDIVLVLVARKKLIQIWTNTHLQCPLPCCFGYSGYKPKDGPEHSNKASVRCCKLHSLCSSE
jgi:hypothetical protein